MAIATMGTRANASCQQDPLILNKLKPSRISRWLLTIIYAIALNL
ncbi:hypothetical protein COO91_01374 [Nostoc flagelliforme CCNUN1]|uniref:Uncharacterized protein n=1 Tax=Nostoc flagelliforme CCNUN1 TaxID=2038116 RepID=A0A2K8SJ38_9NOSO|nr:hypothetical protein COO91_01374 [Nostoc flagelliforme CCNUN1]